MAVIDIDKVTLIYEIENRKYRYDFDFLNNQQAKYNCKYKWIIKLEYHNGLSECFFGYDQVSDNWNSFISVFKKIIYKYDNEKLIDRII